MGSKQQKPKLCYVLPEYSQETSNHFYHIYELLDIASRQLDIFLLIEKCIGHPEFDNIRYIHAMRFRFFPFRVFEHISFYLYVRIRGFRTFYVHQYSTAIIIISLMNKLFGGTTYFWHCGRVADFFQQGSGRWLKSLPRRIFHDYRMTLALKSPDYLVTGSLSMANYYHTIFNISSERIKIMPNWINPQRFYPGIYEREQMRSKLSIPLGIQVVLFVHHLALRKGAHHLVQVALRVIKEVPNVLFVVVGDGPYRKNLECEIRENQLSGKVKLVGAVPNKDVAKYYSVGDVYIMPSEEEGFPRVLIEAMAVGLPFVATYHEGMDSMLTETQFMYTVPQGDMGRFSGKIIEILRKPTVRTKLIDDGLKQVKSYVLDKVADRFIEIVSSPTGV